MRRSIAGGFAGFGLVVWVGWIAVAGAAGAETALERGSALYHANCMNCHGDGGHGDGPMAELLNVPPADLTGLSRRNGGEFPAEEVQATIDGREFRSGHGSRRMPIWGLTFQQLDQDTDQEGEVQQKLRDLVEYLRSIQGGDAGE